MNYASDDRFVLLPDNGQTAPYCFSDWSRHVASDSKIWQSRPLRIKWQYWIAPFFVTF
jgi:hypothetical protein